MEDFFAILLFGAAIFVIFMIAVFVGAIIGAVKMRKFKEYVRQQFPELPEDTEIFGAKQESKKMALNIALVIFEPKEKIIIVVKDKGKEFEHLEYSFSGLASVESSHQVLKRGALWQKTFSYERTMVLKFNDGSAFPFIVEGISNKAGNDKGAQTIKEQFAPWERILNGILDKS